MNVRIYNGNTHIILKCTEKNGGAASEAISLVKKAGAKNVKFMCLIANEKGIAAVNKAHPDVQIYCAAVDPELNDQLYIVPGLGDAGDRMYGTK